MDIASRLKERLGDDWIPVIYRDTVRPLRTRSHRIEIPERENNSEIIYTLMGIELKVGNRRFACPDLAIARYIRAFARIGAAEFAIPYDITKISAIADGIEVSWHNTFLLLDVELERNSPGSIRRARSAVIKLMRQEIAECGAGEQMPLFNQVTKQRFI